MKTFIFQSLALIGTALFIIEVASMPHHPNKRELLKLIISDAKNMSKTWPNDSLKKMVPDPTLGAVKCWVCFFWKAEKSLRASPFKNLSLTRHLHQYNKLIVQLEETNDCVMDNNRTCTLQQLLENIIECANNTV